MKYNRVIEKILISSLVVITFFLGGCSKTSEGIEEAINYIENTSEETQAEEEISKEDTITTTQNIEETVSSIEEETTSEVEQVQGKQKCEPVKVKGIYVSGPIAGTKKMNDLITLVDETELNAMVIDVKNDDGNVTYKMECPAVNDIEASVRYITDIDELVRKCKEKNIYLIARVVAFKDPYLAEKCPDYAIKQNDGGIFRDKKGLAWVNPYNRDVWKYLVEIGKQAARDGFDEVQYDYIRFSTEIKDSKVNYGDEAKDVSKTDIIYEFTKYAYEELSKEGVYVAADVYGTIIDSEVDQRIVGQKYVDMASTLDYICPMVYPSHYGNGVYGIKIPDAEPYRTIKSAMDAATVQLSALDGEHCAINRVWLQCFTASWVNGHISYGKQQIRDQIRGAYEAGYDEWILWNAAVNYSRNNLLTDEQAKKEAEGWKIKKPQVIKSQESTKEEETSVTETVSEDDILESRSSNELVTETEGNT